jgi:hypothetical protein
MYELKTKLNDGDVLAFLNSVENKKRQSDSYVILDLLKDITQEEPKMWGTSIIGFGKYHYKTKSGIESDWMQIGFSPRKQSLTLYLMDGYDKYGSVLEQLGKHKIGKSCLYINKIEDVNLEVLKSLLESSYQYVKENY